LNHDALKARQVHRIQQAMKTVTSVRESSLKNVAPGTYHNVFEKPVKCMVFMYETSEKPGVY
jgi:hypothetical protein